MSIVVTDLDTNISSQIKSAMTEELYYKLRTLPLSHEVEKIKSVVSGPFKEKLDGMVTDYYRAFAERDVTSSISDEDYVNVYLDRV